MKWLLVVLALGIAGPGQAKKKPAKPPTAADAQKSKKENDKSPPPGDKGTNEGAQGRQNATEDAARAAEGNNSYGRP